MAFEDEPTGAMTPITGHHLVFTTSSVSGLEWNDKVQDYVPVNYDADQLNENGYSDINVWGPVVEDNGVYTSAINIPSDCVSNVKPDCDLIPDAIGFSVIDEDAYRAE